MKLTAMIRIQDKRLWLAVAAALTLSALGLIWALPALAAPAAGNLSAKQAEVESLKGEIASINLAAEQAVERYNQANTDLEITQQEIDQNQKALDEATKELDESKARLARRLNSIYRDGQLSFIEVVLNTSSFSEFMTQFDMLGRIGDQDRFDIDQVANLKNEVEQAQADLEATQQRQAELLESVAQEKSTIESQLAARQEVLSSTEGEVAQMLAEQTRQTQQQAGAQAAALAHSAAESSNPASTSDQGGEPGADPEDNGSPPPPDAPPPPASGDAVSIAMQYLGVPYVWGGASPSGFDCSGLVMYVYAQLGIYLPHSAAAQFYSATPVSYFDLAPGDLVFFGDPAYHVGIYAGGGSMIHAPAPGDVVSYGSIGGATNFARL